MPFLHDGDNDNQGVLFRMKRIIYVDHLAECLVHRDCSTDFRGELGQARSEAGSRVVGGVCSGGSLCAARVRWKGQERTQPVCY